MKKLIYIFLTVLIVGCSSDTKKSNESWLFVHTADNAQVTTTTIVMPMTNDIFAFTDRPYRKHLYMNGKQYASLWSNDETNSFYTDPPNAVLTWMDGDGVEEVEVVITDADFDGVNIIYTIENTTIKAKQLLESVSLFVDPSEPLVEFKGYWHGPGSPEAPTPALGHIQVTPLGAR
ncbi:MAG: hypothetical protein O3B88_04390 [Bacteroidetes bacterium]|nr:hypothetical protein [Bacteroidota bacterium]